MEALLLILGFLFLILFPLLFYLFASKHKKGKLNTLKENGKVIEAKITGIHNEAVIERNVVMCRIFAESNIENIDYRFVSEKLYPKDCDHLNQGDPIRVLINPLNPKEYYFDYDPKKMEY